MLKMNKLIYIFLFILLVACQDELNLTPPDKISPSKAFASEGDLELYVNSFYQVLPGATEVSQSDGLSDYFVGRTISSYLQKSYNSTQAGGWTWSDLRNINYFLENYHKAEISNELKANYAGIAKFFRAYFYMEKVKRFGDVPWYNKTMDVDDPDLYKGRDPRTLVMDSVLADINFACDHILANKDVSCTTITKWVALAYKSRICLYEGTFRKYHTELGLESTANYWLGQASEAAKKVMDSGTYSINVLSDASKSYRDLFVNEVPNSKEIMLAAVCSKELRVLNDANWYWTSTTYGGRYSFIKSFINTYLKIDGSRFTDTENFNDKPFWSEVKNRDLRLKQTIRMGDYSREGIAAPPDFTYTYSGYMPYKFTLDSKATDGVSENANSLPLFRYAEVLLNYAEAKAELGTFNDDDWNKTINVLRSRAGIKSTSIPQNVDVYLQRNFFPNVSDKIILEVRRERGIELAMEGFRYSDLMRWKLGKLLEMTYDGMFVPALNTPLDLNEDGKLDVSFVNKIPTDKVSGVYYFVIDNNQFKLMEVDKGILILFSNLERNFDDHKYYYPIPYDEIVLNPNLSQNPGWQ